MQYSDALAVNQTQHRNASKLGSPITYPKPVAIANLTPLVWNSGNNQHSIHNVKDDSLDLRNATSMKLGQVDPSFATWHLRDYLVG